MHGARNSPWNKILFALPSKNSEREREREQKRTDEISYTNLCCVFLLCLMLLSLSCVSFFSSLYVFTLCVYFLFLCILLALFFVLFPCVPLSIYREIPKKLLPYFSLNWSDHGVVFVSFPSTTPNFMLSRHPLFSFFLFYLFCYFLSSFFLVCDIPTFRLLRPNFIRPCSLEAIWMSDFHNL